MSNLKYLVLSDLHLGAGYSLLTNADDAGRAQPADPSPVLNSLGAGLRSLLPRLTPQSRPTLVLLGDVYDLSFASPQHAAAAFERLIEVLWAEPGLFADRIVYVPGNHDHRMWRLVRDAAFLDDVRRHGGDGLLDELVVTTLDPDSMMVSELATALAQRATGRTDVVVEAGYPNIGMHADGNAVVMHHGHYTEGTYRMMSKVAELLSGRSPNPSLRELEMLNGPWIDFGWSNTGDQRELGPLLYSYYEMLQDPAATHATVQNLATKLIDAASAVVPVRGETVIEVHGFEASVQCIAEGLLDLTIDRAAQTERSSVNTVLSPAGVEGVRAYLAGPVRAQLDQAGWADAVTSGHVSFIFGHTHKPFQDELLVSGYTHPVQVWNTGGWVLDHPGMSPTQGAAAILVDDRANVASLRLFNDPLDGSVGTVRAAGCHASDRENPLLGELTAALEADPDAWAQFSRDCLEGLDMRAAILRRASFDPTAHPPARGRRVRSAR